MARAHIAALPAAERIALLMHCVALTFSSPPELRCAALCFAAGACLPATGPQLFGGDRRHVTTFFPLMHTVPPPTHTHIHSHIHTHTSREASGRCPSLFTPSLFPPRAGSLLRGI